MKTVSFLQILALVACAFAQFTNPRPYLPARNDKLQGTGNGSEFVAQAKSTMDARDIAGIDCTRAADSSAALNAVTGNAPSTDNALNGKTLSLARCRIKLTSTWFIKNQAGSVIDVLTHDGSGSHRFLGQS